MPNRIIREGLIESEAVNSLSPEAECCFIRLILKADDFGRYTGNTLLLKAALFPLKPDVRTSDISRWIAACEKAGLIREYQVSGKSYLEISRFGQRARADKSKFPDPLSHVEHPANAGTLLDGCQTHDRQPPDRGKTSAPVVVVVDVDVDVVEDVVGRARSGEHAYSPVFENAWLRYPKRSGDNPKLSAYQCWTARLKAGATPEAMTAGVERYAAYCLAAGKTGSELVMQAKRFFGREQPFENPWDFTPPPQTTRSRTPPIDTDALRRKIEAEDAEEARRETHHAAN